jgi:hypothetical protein
MTLTPGFYYCGFTIIQRLVNLQLQRCSMLECFMYTKRARLFVASCKLLSWRWNLRIGCSTYACQIHR